MHTEAVKSYLASSTQLPFFLFVSDQVYSSVIAELNQLEFQFLKTSDFCLENDRFPDFDLLIDRIKSGAGGLRQKKIALLGLGECLGLRGNLEAINILSRLKDADTCGVKIVLVLRSLVSQIGALKTDPRFDNRRFDVLDKARCDLSFLVNKISTGHETSIGFKAMLSSLESGLSGRVSVNTGLHFNESIFHVRKIDSAYEELMLSYPFLKLSPKFGREDQWHELLMKLEEHKGSFDELRKSYGYCGRLAADIFTQISGSDFRNWLFFIILKLDAPDLGNIYLEYVVNKTACFEDLKSNLLNGIIEISLKEKEFPLLYAERKRLLEKFPESDIAGFVVNNRKYPEESIYRLTDNTKTEREEIVAWISKHGLIPQITSIYPALAAYLKEYVFDCGELSSHLTGYFNSYKLQKVRNSLQPEFLSIVDEIAIDRQYNRLPARSEIIDSLKGNDDVVLFWIDALGVEFLSYITGTAKTKGLSISINVGRAELPTITKINRVFFDEWNGRKEKFDELDEIKHKDAGGYNFRNNELPIHLAGELDVLEKIMDRAATELALRHFKRILIVSDHGASRLAVLRRKEEKYDTDTQGEHSGRCCKKFEPYDLPFAAEENGYLVLADYGRFRGSRAANVEVHGGASLEEVLVPIIELKLKDEDIAIELVESSVLVDIRKGISVMMFSNTPLNEMSLIIGNKRYKGKPDGENHYRVDIPDIRKAGEYLADVYCGDDFICNVLIKAQSRSGRVNDDFDDLF